MFCTTRFRLTQRNRSILVADELPVQSLGILDAQLQTPRIDGRRGDLALLVVADVHAETAGIIDVTIFGATQPRIARFVTCEEKKRARRRTARIFWWPPPTIGRRPVRSRKRHCPHRWFEDERRA